MPQLGRESGKGANLCGKFRAVFSSEVSEKQRKLEQAIVDGLADPHYEFLFDLESWKE